MNHNELKTLKEWAYVSMPPEKAVLLFQHKTLRQHVQIDLLRPGIVSVERDQDFLQALLLHIVPHGVFVHALPHQRVPVVQLVPLELFRETLHSGRAFNALATLAPENIEKVTVLKNATALYGARGANGVILIETKRGHSMATRIDVGLSAGVTLKPRTQTMMNASQWRDYATEMLGTMTELKK